MEESKEKAAWGYLKQIYGERLKHLESYGLPVVVVLQMLYPKSLSVCLSISAEPISSREKPLFCSDLPTVSSPALIKGHQPLMRFC